MPKKKILAADDDPDILDIIKLALEDEYNVVIAHNGEEAIEEVYKQSPDLVLLDYIMPKLNGLEVCRRLKSDILLRHMPVVMLTGKGELRDKVTGLGAGADDYIVKPFEPEELLARINTIIRRSEADLDANPLSKLPGNVTITKELEKRIGEGGRFAVCYLDLDNFKAYNDTYGFKKGDEIIRYAARTLLDVMQNCGNRDDFLGHIGGDDFVYITNPDQAEGLCQKIISSFDLNIGEFYNEEDLKRGFIVSKDRKGETQEFPLISISIGIVSNEAFELKHPAEIGAIGAELKAFAKTIMGSSYVKERRSKKTDSEETPEIA
ncbi:MAG: response regulator [Candidatus Omnitrophica bacterium]|nr:response regulator [Candidatus Omnitrophota bacterium]